jgi:hypothetical protein
MKIQLQKSVFIAFLMCLGFGINQTVNATTYYSKASGSPSTLTNWGINTNGTGTAPANFTTATDVFILSLGSTLTTAGNWTIGSGVTLQIDGTLSINGNNNKVTINGTVIFTKTNATQVLLTGAGSGNTFVLGASATLKTNNVNGIQGLNCSLPVNSTKITVTLSVTNYEFNGASQSTLGLPASVNNLIMSGSGTKTFTRSTTVGGNLSVLTGVKINLSTFILNNAASLTLGGLGTIAGSWGSTTSTASKQNNTYFAATTGYITVSSDSRTTPTVTTTVGVYTYNGLAQGPVVATNTGTSSNYTYSYVGDSGTTYTTTATLPTNAGSYLVSVTVAASSDGFYKAASSDPTSFSIAKAGLSITANSGSKCEGATYSVGSGSTAFSATALQNSETIASITITSTGASAGATAGSYSIVPTAPIAAIGGAFSASNYTISYSIGSLIVNPTPTQPLVIETSPTCALQTGTIAVTVQNATDTYSIDDNEFSNTTGIFTSLPAGTYSVSIKNSSGCISSAVSVTFLNPVKTWNGSLNTDWNTADNWTPSGVPPVSTNCIIIPNEVNAPVISGTNYVAYANTLTISGGGGLVVLPTNSIIVTDFVNVNPGGALTFENNSSLIQINNATNTGNITYKRTTSIIANNYDFQYWGSPVLDQPLGTIWMASSWTDTFYNFDSKTTNNWVRNYAADTMIKGKGYISRARNGQTGLDYSGVSSLFNIGGTWTAKFYGVPNNGSIPVSNITTGNYCLLSNPYPSAIDADAFLLKNKLVLGGTLYFWTHNTSISNNTYSSNDYASYNGVGGTATAKSISSGTNTNLPSGKIASGQAFFATAIASNDVLFENRMRLDNANNELNNAQFFKTTSTNKTKTESQKNRIWLNLSNNQGVFKQTLLGYITGATNTFDESFDGQSINGNTYADFYSINENKNLTIQGRALPFDENDMVPLGFKTTLSGDFIINIDKVDGLFSNQSIYIEDKLTNTVFDLKSGDYTFSTIAGTFNDRFVLTFVNKNLSTDSFSSKENKVLISNKNKQIKIKSTTEPIDKVLVYDLLGRLVYQKNNISSLEYSIVNLVSSNQALLVKTILESGIIVTQKVIL